MLPEDGHEHEDGGDEDQGQRHLRDGARGEGLHVVHGVVRVGFFVPAWEGGEEEEADEGEDDGDDSAGSKLGSLTVLRRETEGWGSLGGRGRKTYIR